jgi:hypothetical protein
MPRFNAFVGEGCSAPPLRAANPVPRSESNADQNTSPNFASEAVDEWSEIIRVLDECSAVHNSILARPVLSVRPALLPARTREARAGCGQMRRYL